jgi:hypothetical protein
MQPTTSTPVPRNQSQEAKRQLLMKDIEDIELKAEMDEIMRSVESIMQKVEAILPSRPEASDPMEE